MYYSYVMGISNSIDELKTKGFIIEKDGNNFMVSFQNEEVLKLCEELCNCRFGSIRKMLEGNRFYKDKIELIKKEGI